jgi:WS/DGAT/MGAT family acyltransferase
MMLFDEPVDLQALKDVIGARMLCFHRFRQRPVGQGSDAFWETDPHFDIDWHVRRIALPDDGGQGALENAASDLISTPLDPTKPMWQFHLIDSLQGGSAIVLRIHHCYGDGFALMHVVMAMTDVDPRKPQPAGTDLAGDERGRSAWERIFAPVTEVVGDVLHSSLAVAGAGRDLLMHPLHAVEYAKTGTDIVSAAGVFANMTPDSPTRLKGALGVMKRVAWAEPLSLLEVKAVASAFACSVNDVLVACVAGALRTYLQEQGDDVEGNEVRALVPVNLRPPGRITELGNRFGLVFLSLPIGIDDPVERVLEVHQRMAELKGSQQPLVSLGILAALGVAPEFIKERTVEALAANASMIITNVRGSEQPRYFAGKRIARQMFWVPQSGGIGVGVSILSYAGQVSFGLVTDVRRVPDPQAVAMRFTLEFEALLLCALMMPWPGDAAIDDTAEPDTAA